MIWQQLLATTKLAKKGGRSYDVPKSKVSTGMNFITGFICTQV